MRIFHFGIIMCEKDAIFIVILCEIKTCLYLIQSWEHFSFFPPFPLGQLLFMEKENEQYFEEVNKLHTFTYYSIFTCLRVYG